MIFKREKEIVANIATAVTGYKVTPELMEAPTRKREVTIARHVLMYILWENKITLSTIGDAFRKDHATVIHARKRVKKDLNKGNTTTTLIYKTSKEKVESSILANVKGEMKKIITLQNRLESTRRRAQFAEQLAVNFAEQIEITKKRAKFREQQAIEDAERVVSYALEMMERGNAQGWARHRLKLKVAEVFPEMVLNN